MAEEKQEKRRSEDKYHLKQICAGLAVVVIVAIENAYADIQVLKEKAETTKSMLKEIRDDVKYIRQNMD